MIGLKKKKFYLLLSLVMLLSIASQAFAITDTNLVAWYKLNETSGTTLSDASIYQRNLILGSATLGQTGIIGNGIKAGAANNTSPDRNIKDANFEFTGNFSVNQWVKMKTTSNGEMASTFSRNNGNKYYGWWTLIQSNKFYTQIGDATVTIKCQTASTQTITADGSWHMLTAVYNKTAGRMLLYVDSVLDANTACSTTPIYDTFSYFALNGWQYDALGQWQSGGIDGNIDEVSVWGNRVLTQLDINELYNNRQGLSYPFNVIADFNYSINKALSRIDLNDTSTPKYSYSVNSWVWKVNGTQISIDQNTNYSTTQLTDLNICLTATDTNNTTATTCKIFNTGDWQSPTTTFVTSYQIANSVDQNITLNCTDNNSGCFITDYRIDGNTTWTHLTDGNVKDVNKYIIYVGAGTHTIDFNSIDASGNQETTKTSSFTTNPNLTYPGIDFNANPTYGFGTGTIPLALRCTTNIIDQITYDINVDVNGVNTNLLHAIDNNNVTRTYTYTPTNTGLTFIGTCTDASGNITTKTLDKIYDVNFLLVNDLNGTPLTVGDLASFTVAKVYSLDGNLVYDFKANNKVSVNLISGYSQLQFEFDYNYTTLGGTITQYPPVLRFIDFGLLTDRNSRICTPFAQTFYQQRIVSNQSRQVILKNQVANCYVLSGSLSFAYDVGYAQTLYTVNRPYYLYFVSNNVPTYLALIDGSQSASYNIDTILFSKQPFTLNINLEGLSMQPLYSESGGHLVYNTGTIQIYYKNIYNDNTGLKFDIYDTNNNALVWSQVLDLNANESLVNFYWAGTPGVNIDSNLKLIVTTTKASGVTSSTTYFNVWGDLVSSPNNTTPTVSSKFHVFAAIASLLIFFFGLTLVASSRVFGFFGMLIVIISLIICGISLQTWYIQLLEAVYLSTLFFIILMGRQTDGGGVR